MGRKVRRRNTVVNIDVVPLPGYRLDMAAKTVVFFTRVSKAEARDFRRVLADEVKRDPDITPSSALRKIIRGVIASGRLPSVEQRDETPTARR